MTLPKSSRFIHSFGHREMELAAIAIVDHGWLDARFHFSRQDVIEASRRDDLVGTGFDELVAHGWLEPASPGRVRVVPDFVARCQRAIERDEQHVREGTLP